MALQPAEIVLDSTRFKYQVKPPSPGATVITYEAGYAEYTFPTVAVHNVPKEVYEHIKTLDPTDGLWLDEDDIQLNDKALSAMSLTFRSSIEPTSSRVKIGDRWVNPTTGIAQRKESTGWVDETLVDGGTFI